MVTWAEQRYYASVARLRSSSYEPLVRVGRLVSAAQQVPVLYDWYQSQTCLQHDSGRSNYDSELYASGTGLEIFGTEMKVGQKAMWWIASAGEHEQE